MSTRGSSRGAASRLLLAALTCGAAFAGFAGCLVFDHRALPADGGASSDASGDATLDTSTDGGDDAAGDASGITFVGPATQASSDQASFDFPVPSALQIGELLWLTMISDKAASTVTPPTGWTKFRDCTETDRDYHAFVFYRVSDGSDLGTYHFTVASTHIAETALLLRYAGVDTTRLPPVGQCDARGTGGSFAAASLDTQAAGSPATVVVTMTDDVGCAPWTPTAPLVTRGTSTDGLVFGGDFATSASPSPAVSATCSSALGGGVVGIAVLHAK